MHVNSCFSDFWTSEGRLYRDLEGAIFCSDRNDAALIPYALIRNASDIERLQFALQYWESCCRLSERLGLSYISMRIADTAILDREESELTVDDWSDRICTLTGPSSGPPQNGSFFSSTTKLWIKLSDGALGLKSGEQVAAQNP